MSLLEALIASALIVATGAGAYILAAGTIGCVLCRHLKGWDHRTVTPLCEAYYTMLIVAGLAGAIYLGAAAFDMIWPVR